MAEATQGGEPNRALITVCAMAATLMQALDGTIANVALPYMQGGLSSTADQVTWVLTSYIVAAAIFTSPVGALAARYGRKRIFLISVGGFTFASVLCGAAQSLEQMVAFRLMQGAFGAALVPLSQATMLDIYPPARRGSAMAVWGMGVMLGPILGPTLGGWLTEAYDWRWVFYVNLPVGLLAFAGLSIFLHDDRPATARPFDVFGFAALSIGIGALQLMLDRGQREDWFESTEILIEAGVAALGLWLFLVHLLTAPRPFIPPRIFRDRNFLSGLMMMFVVGAILFSTSALLAPYLQTLGGYPVFDAGLVLAPRGVGTMMAMMVAGRVADRVDPRALMMFGIAVMGWSLWDMTGWTPDLNAHHLMFTTAAQGFGLGFIFVPLQVIAFATLSPDLRTDGTALTSLVRNIGSAIGISATIAVLEHDSQVLHAEIAALVSPLNRLLHLPGVAQFWDPGTPAGAALLNAEVTRQAQVMAYANDFHLLLLLCIPTAILVLLMRRPATLRPAEPGHAAMD
ncbi:DHA2 family efflux MFS transporter permease subunit [Roseomonas sp. JC162]|uniref:DHA2 family efflux MFS transporter permease subunit n=1 Tax=Neoroseomonas marina TaxID=1232220 RepID=A0A848EA26_9PROT|nr:DHA2 family efflux MFS transporter permease subunit [Neoroseomonas marina]NMJ40320.1 DHA2 family efflux MFS transporter permease subunit [Neoroseomonas marina]